MKGYNVKVFSKSQGGDIQLSTNFKAKEFACSDGSDFFVVSPELVTILQKVRDWAKGAVYVNSGFRTESHNSKVGGAKNSYHKYGMAADITVNGKTPAQVCAFLESVMLSGGIGKYKTFTHVDVRPIRYRFDVTSGKEKAVNSF